MHPRAKEGNQTADPPDRTNSTEQHERTREQKKRAAFNGSLLLSILELRALHLVDYHSNKILECLNVDD